MTFAVLDWRRQTAALYAEIRAEADPRAAHRRWGPRRQELFRTHPASADPGAVLWHADYDSRWRFEVDVEDTPVARIEVETATDGVVPFVRIGRVQLDGVGALDVWWLDSYGGGVWLPVFGAGPASYGGGPPLVPPAEGGRLGGGLRPPHRPGGPRGGPQLPPHPPG